jgi:hypothetical protein
VPDIGARLPRAGAITPRGTPSSTSWPFHRLPAFYSFDVERGFTTEALASNLDTWASVLPSFIELIGY